MGLLLRFGRSRPRAHGPSWIWWPESDARPDRFFPSDASPRSTGGRRLPDPERLRRQRWARGTGLLFLAVLFGSGVVAMVFGRSGLVELRRSRRELTRLEAEVAGRRAALEGLRLQAAALERDPGAVERIAREQLGLVRPGEITFLLPEEPPKSSSP